MIEQARGRDGEQTSRMRLLLLLVPAAMLFILLLRQVWDVEDWRVAYDGRYYRYSSEEWQYDIDIESGTVPLAEVVRKWKPAAFVLDARRDAPITGELDHNKMWQRIYAKDGIVAYVPVSDTTQSLAAN
jgi:hypothetical protein